MFVKPSDDLLVAVSGGSDSLALLHRLHTMRRNGQHTGTLFAATVDHGLRPEAASEAQWVAQWCRKQAIEHATLKWQPEGKSAQAARVGRYSLLAHHARTLDVKTICFGHTLDDQAETVLMRALRSKPDSGTIGLSGMHERTAYEELTLWRPLLSERREVLRAELTSAGIQWIDDPSNDDRDRERVRARSALTTRIFPPAETIARLAHLSQKDRAWLSTKTARLLASDAEKVNDETLTLTIDPATPPRLLREAFSILIMASGGLDHRPSTEKYTDCIHAALKGERLVKTVGRTLVTIKDYNACFVRESRHLDAEPSTLQAPFQRFRSASDDPVFDVMHRLIG